MDAIRQLGVAVYRTIVRAIGSHGCVIACEGAAMADHFFHPGGWMGGVSPTGGWSHIWRAGEHPSGARKISFEKDHFTKNNSLRARVDAV
jgi:hypothetical protein